MSLEVRSDPAESILLDGEPLDTADISEVRHWIRVYSGLLEAVDGSQPVASRTRALSRRLQTWRQRLDFWQGRAREESNPVRH